MLELPYPPSVNHYFSFVRGRPVLGKDVRLDLPRDEIAHDDTARLLVDHDYVEDLAPREDLDAALGDFLHQCAVSPE